jgi:hypothetical protein
MKKPFQDAKIKNSRGSITCALTQRGYMEQSAQTLVMLFNMNALLKNVNLLV